MTNLLQPADVCWFASIKREYKRVWSSWYMNEDKSLTRTGNTKSPGYVKCCSWLSAIWSCFDSDLIKKSFTLCGIEQHEVVNGKIRVKWNKLHSVLRSMLEHKKIINNYVCEEDGEDEARFQADENDPLLFGTEDVEMPEGFLEDDSDMDAESADNVADELEILDRLLATDQTNEVTLDTLGLSFFNFQSWRHAVDVDTINSGQTADEYLEFTPPTSAEHNSSAPQTSSSASSTSTATPQVPKKRIRRTKEQISQGITLEQLRATNN
jgi:hypothetical protein